MNRRALLASLGTTAGLLAGCQELGASTRTTTPSVTTPKPRTASDCTFHGNRTVSLAEMGDVPDETGLDIEATLERNEITERETVRLTVTVTNTGPTRMTPLADEEYCHVFDRQQGVSRNGLRLFRQQDAPPVDEGDCWRKDKDPSETQTFIDIGCRAREFPTGDAISTTYELWHFYSAEGYFPPGTFHFSTSISLWPPDDEDAETTVGWWLELEITD